MSCTVLYQARSAVRTGPAFGMMCTDLSWASKSEDASLVSEDRRDASIFGTFPLVLVPGGIFFLEPEVLGCTPNDASSNSESVEAVALSALLQFSSSDDADLRRFAMRDFVVEWPNW